jgi:hypothetical protein
MIVFGEAHLRRILGAYAAAHAGGAEGPDQQDRREEVGPRQHRQPFLAF